MLPGILPFRRSGGHVVFRIHRTSAGEPYRESAWLVSAFASRLTAVRVRSPCVPPQLSAWRFDPAVCGAGGASFGLDLGSEMACSWLGR
jgi:hypothetical protein